MAEQNKHLYTVLEEAKPSNGYEVMAVAIDFMGGALLGSKRHEFEESLAAVDTRNVVEVVRERAILDNSPNLVAEQLVAAAVWGIKKGVIAGDEREVDAEIESVIQGVRLVRSGAVTINEAETPKPIS